MSTFPHITNEELDRMAWQIERNGLAGQLPAIRRLLERATTGPVSKTLVDVLGDATQSEVARIRAFGHVAMQVANRTADEPAPVAA